MVTIYEVDIDKSVVKNNIQRIVGQTFKLLPTREEGKDWKKPLNTLIIELTGMFSLFPDLTTGLAIVCKMEGLRQGGSEIDFADYRRTIFECCSLLSKLQNRLEDE